MSVRVPSRLVLPATLLFISLAPSLHAQVINTFAGGGAPTQDPKAFPLPNIRGVAVDRATGDVYISSADLNVVYRVNASTGLMTLVAGNGQPGFSGDGSQATSAKLNGPEGLAVLNAGATTQLYIADAKNNRVRLVDLGSGVIVTHTGTGVPGPAGDGGPAVSAQLNNPRGVAVDAAGTLYIADEQNQVVRKVLFTPIPGQGTITTVANTGGAAVPSVAVSANSLFFVSGFTTKRVPLAGGSATLLNFTCVSTNLSISFESPLVAESPGHSVFATCFSSLERLDFDASGLPAGQVLVAGSPSSPCNSSGPCGDGGQARFALLTTPLAVASTGNSVFIADSGDLRVRKMNGLLDSSIINAFAGTGTRAPGSDGGSATSAALLAPYGGTIAGGFYYFADKNDHRVRRVNLSNNVITTVAGTGFAGYSGDNGTALLANLNNPTAVALNGNTLYIADSGNNVIRTLDINVGTITTLPVSIVPALTAPSGLLVSGGALFISDAQNRVLTVQLSNNATSVFAGTGAPGCGGNGNATSVALTQPKGLGLDSVGAVYIADSGCGVIRKVLSGTITTVAGGGATLGDNGPPLSAQLTSPSAVVFDTLNQMYIAEAAGQRIRKVANNTITTAAGNGTAGFSGDTGLATLAKVSNPNGLAADGNGTVYIADSGNLRVRSIFGGIALTLNTSPQGLAVQIDGGIAVATPVTVQVPANSQHTISVASPQVPTPGTQYVFLSWSDAGAQSHQINVGASPVSFTASFKKQYLLTLSANAPGAASLSPASGYQDANAVVNISATPNGGFTFINWAGMGSGSFSGATNAAQVTMNGPITELASFSGGTATSARINAGGGVYTDPNGNQYAAGDFGNRFGVSDRIAGTATAFPYQSEAWNSGPLTRIVALANGTYNVRLKFAEIFFNKSGQRSFDILLNGATVANAYDIAADAGASDTAVDRIFQTTVSNGQISVTLNPVVSNPKVSAIEIVPAQIDLTVAPTVAVLTAGQTRQFTSRVIGTGNTAVNWTLNPNVGTIDSTGLYTAPANVTTRQLITVTATSAADNTKTATATIKLGFAWQSQDIGTPNAAGSFSGQTEAYTVTGAGDLNGASDSFRFAYQSLTGDGQIVARISTTFVPNASIKTGVIIRESTAPGAPYAMMSLYDGIVGLFQTRASSGGATTVQFGAAGVFWVRIARAGSTFTGYVSNDGILWQQVGSANITMNNSALVGLAVSSGFQPPATAVFDNIDITSPVSVAVDQTLISLGPSQQSQLTATVTGTANTAVNWTITPAGQGSITAGGLYTAPSTLNPSVQTVTITATSAADASKSASVVAQLGAFQTIRINAGGPSHIDPNLTFWQGDTGANVGTSFSNGTPIPNTSTPYLYQSEHFAPGAFSYNYFVPNGTYTVTLKFAEVFFTSVGQRVFNVTLNGTPILSNYDVVQQAGGAFMAVDQTFPVTVNNGVITIAFTPVTSAPKVNAIQITAP